MSKHIELKPETVEALKREQVRATVLSLLIAFLVVVLFSGLLALMVQVMPSVVSDEGISVILPEKEEESLPAPPPTVPKSVSVAVSPPASSFSGAQVLVGVTPVSIVIPMVDQIQTEEMVEFSAEEGFGSDPGFEAAWAAESSFFGAPLKGRRVCYVIDYSASMQGMRDDLMRKELKSSISQLKGGGEFSLIFFSGPVWQAGDKAILDSSKRGGLVTDGLGNSFKWHTKEHQQDWQPEGKKQKMGWREASVSELQKARDQIEETPLLFGTYWENPLRYAIEMEPAPDIILFMTDGASGSRSLEIAEKMAKKASRKKIVINTVSLMEPRAMAGMLLLAERTGGSATMVKSESEVIDLRSGEVKGAY